MLIEQVDRLLDERSLTVFEMQPQLLQPLGVTIAYPALQPAVGFLFTLHMLALPLGIVVWDSLGLIHVYFLAHMTLQWFALTFVISNVLMTVV